MRSRTMAVLTAALTAALTIPALALDEGVSGALRTDVPEAGVALSLPAGWGVDIEMRERQDWGLFDEGLAEDAVPFWSVIYASDGGRPWCDLTWYPQHPLPLAEHALRYEALLTPSTGVERPIEIAAVELPSGPALRFVVSNEPTDDFTIVYLVGAGEDAGTARYLLRCVDDERAVDDWLHVAESLELFEPPSDEENE